jgi:type IV pilus assembly protein PilA
MKSLFRKMAKGQGGFTLVELLVVVAILGVIAAVAVLAVTKFIGKGTLEAAKTELHQAQTAVAACMADAGTGLLEAWDDTTGWAGESGTIYYGNYDAGDYVHGLFKAFYQVRQDGEITGVGAETWNGVHWDTGEGNWVNDT